MKNVEIKAKVYNIEQVEKAAKKMSDSELVIINQHDIFFHIPSSQVQQGGRLKLRQFSDGTGELIYYERPNVEGPKLCNYSKVEFDAEKQQQMKTLLTQSNGVLGEVKKTRHLYMVGQTRIHIDRVHELGNFMELEVVLKKNDDLAKGEEIANKIMKDLGITEDSLLSGAYMDMIMNKNYQ